MKLQVFLFSLLLLTSSKTLASNPNCEAEDQGSNLKVYHIFSPCSPFKPSTSLSWEETVLQLQADDKARLQFLSSLVAGRSVVPIASGRQITQNPTYIVRVKVGTPPRTFLMAMDTNNDAAWLPCERCLGCSSPVVYSPVKSTTSRFVNCGAPQCKQVSDILYILQPLSSLCSCVGPVCHSRAVRRARECRIQ